MTTAKQAILTYTDVATFSTTAPTAGATWEHIGAIDLGDPKLVQDFDEADESGADGSSSLMYPTAKGSAFDFSTRHYTGTKAFDGTGGDTDPTKCFYQLLFDSYFGMLVENAFTGNTVASGGPGASTPVTLTGGGANINPGHALMFGAVGGSAAEIRNVTIRSTNVVTLDDDLDTAANYAASAIVYGGWNWRPTMTAYAKHLYLNWEAAHRSVMLGPGQVVSLKLKQFGARQALRWEFGFAGDTYATGVTPSSLTKVTERYTGAPLVAVGAPVTINGTDTLVEGLEIDFGIKKEPIVATSGTNGLAGWENVECVPTVSWTEYYSAQRWTDYAAATAYPLRLNATVGGTNVQRARGAIAVYAPQVNFKVEEARLNGQRAMKVSGVCKRPTPTQLSNSLSASIALTIFGGA